MLYSFFLKNGYDTLKYFSRIIMIDFNDVMFRIKQILTQDSEKKKIFDKDIALALDLNPQNYAVIKRRKRIPYESIAYFSKKHKLNMNWILFAQKPRYLT